MKSKLAINQGREVAAICLVFPSPAKRDSESISIRLNDLVKIIEPSVESIFVITRKDAFQNIACSDKVHFAGHLSCPSSGDPILSTIYGELKAQLQIAQGLAALPKGVKLIFWRGRSSTVITPLLLAKLKGKKSILLLESRGSELISKIYKGRLGVKGFVLNQLYKIIEKVTYSFSDKLVVDVPGLLTQPWLCAYKSKVFPLAVAERFVDHAFKVSKPLDDRDILVGYIGRMSSEKGVLNLIKAVQSIANQMSEVKFLFGGNGPLFQQIERELDYLVSQGKVEIRDWIPYSTLPDCLNEIKLLVLPSYYEGLPNVMLEAMACGTPVVATPVGAVPDIIVDGETGFIIEDNSPECIAENVIRTLNYPRLDKVAESARAFVESQYSYEAMAAKYGELLDGL